MELKDCAVRVSAEEFLSMVIPGSQEQTAKAMREGDVCVLFVGVSEKGDINPFNSHILTFDLVHLEDALTHMHEGRAPSIYCYGEQPPAKMPDLHLGFYFQKLTEWTNNLDTLYEQEKQLV